MSTEEKHQFPKLKSVDHIVKLPIIETGFQYASVLYTKVKNANFLIRWGLSSVEGTVYMVWDKSMVGVPLIEVPLHIVDEFVCKGLDIIEQRVPIITYPPQLLYNMTKDYVSSKFIDPVKKRADTVKRLSISGASKYGEFAVSRLDSALDAADKYVDKYLPDAADSAENKENIAPGNNKAKQAIDHANRLRRKLKRRLTRRTVAEAKALRQQGVDVMQFLIYMADLLIHDPRQLMEKLHAIWDHLSEDEPENQVPPANLEQLITMISREMARRSVHFINFTTGKVTLLPKYTILAFHTSTQHISFIADYLLKEALLSHFTISKKQEMILAEPTGTVVTPSSPKSLEEENKKEKEKESPPKQHPEAVQTEQNSEENLTKKTRPNGDAPQLNQLPSN